MPFRTVKRKVSVRKLVSSKNLAAIAQALAWLGKDVSKERTTMI